MGRIWSDREVRDMLLAHREWSGAKGKFDLTGFFAGWGAGIDWWRENAPTPDETEAFPFAPREPTLAPASKSTEPAPGEAKGGEHE